MSPCYLSLASWCPDVPDVPAVGFDTRELDSVQRSSGWPATQGGSRVTPQPW
jgi:hypothetical protein